MSTVTTMQAVPVVGAPRWRGIVPSGVGRLLLFQFWDNVAFYGSRLLLVLYLLDRLTHPAEGAAVWGLSAAHAWAADHLGMRSDQAFVSAIMGLFGALAAFTPVVGGWLSDRYISRRAAVIAGSLMMAAGHAMLACQTPFLLGLALLSGGNGLYRSSVGAMMAAFFPRDDPRLASGFQLAYFASNAALIITPLLCGGLGELAGWSWGFGAASIAMLIGLATFLSAPAPPLIEQGPPRDVPIPDGTHTVRNRLLLIGGVILFMIGNEQLSNAMVVWLKEEVDRDLGIVTIPITWFFSLTPLAVCAAAGLIASRRAPSAVATMRRRMIRGCLIGACAWGLLALAADATRVSAVWPILFLLVWGVAFAHVLPSGAGLIAELTPSGSRGSWLGLYYAAVMIASVIMGWMGGLYGHLTHSRFIALHGVVVLIAAPVFALLPARRTPQLT